MIQFATSVQVPKQYLILFDKYANMFPKKEYYNKTYLDRNDENAMCQWLQPANENDTVLDIGCACSYFVVTISKFAQQVYGIDLIQDGYAAYVAVPWLETMDYFEEYQTGRIKIISGNAKELPFPENYFDKIYTFSALEHFDADDDKLCAQEVYRVLKPGGLFMGTVDFNPTTEHPFGEGSICRTYTYKSFCQRILEPSGLVLVGEDYVKDIPIPESVAYPAISLFFILRKD